MTLFLASSVVAHAAENEQMELVHVPCSFSDCISKAMSIQTSTWEVLLRNGKDCSIVTVFLGTRAWTVEAFVLGIGHT